LATYEQLETRGPAGWEKKNWTLASGQDILNLLYSTATWRQA